MVLGFLFLISSYSEPDFDSLRQPIEGVSLEKEYSRLWNSKSEILSESDLEVLREKRILIVPGFLSNVTAEIKKNFGWMVPEMRKDFDEQFQWLRDHGIQAEKVKVESEGPIQNNADSIQAAIENSDRPVILISHSKGGLDILQAMFDRKDLQPKVAGWVPIQSPFFGTPVADHWTKSDKAKKIADGILKRLGGSSKCLLELRVEDRKPYMEAHAADLQNLLQIVPTIAFASWKRDEPGNWDTPFEPFFRDQLNRAEIKSDGVIPMNSMVLPGAPYVALEGIDHVTTIGAIQLKPFDRVRFTQVMLKLLLRES